MRCFLQGYITIKVAAGVAQDTTVIFPVALLKNSSSFIIRATHFHKFLLFIEPHHNSFETLK